MMFRLLRPDEIDCRIATIREGKGLSLLLYKDARCDMNILDETVGPMNWTRSHSRENANCTVSIWDSEKKLWISKEDTGTESYTEKEKGLASDSFKRACFNWGIGRELYTAPFIWISAKDCNIVSKDGRPACYDRFTVSGIDYGGGRISYLEIVNEKKGKVVYTFGTLQKDDSKIRMQAKIRTIEKSCEKRGTTPEAICEVCGFTWGALDEDTLDKIIRNMQKKGWDVCE